MTDRRRLGASDLMIAPLVLGGNVFGWTADRDASFAILDAFADGGGTMIDTADVYHSKAIDDRTTVESETIIGEWLRARGKRDRVLLATKVGWAPERGGALDPAHIATACDASLRRLGVEAIDLYYVHQDDEKVPQEEVAEALARLVQAGKVRVLGASNFPARRLKSAIEGARAAGLPHYQVLQPEYNLLSRHKYEGELQDYCVEHNIGVLPYLGLAAGLLTGKYRAAADLDTVRARRVKMQLDGRALAVLAAMDAVAAETGAAHAAIALAWLKAQPGVVAPIASASKPEQVDDLLAAMRLELSEDQLSRLSNAGA